MNRVAGLVLFLAASAVQAREPVTQIHYVMGTYYRITAEGDGARAALRDCFADARRLDDTFSRFDPSSELARVNLRAGSPTTVSADFARLLARALRLARSTGGAFDPTVGPLSALWRATVAPDDRALATARARVGVARVALRGDDLRLAPGTVLDFDGIAKGFAADRCAERLRQAGVRRALVSLGESSLVALGGPWEVAVRGEDDDTTVGVLVLHDQAASVSATLRADAGGRRRAHIVDPQTGAPRHEAAVGIVVARSATDAEAWSKALLLWGAAGVARVEALGAAGAVHLTPGHAIAGARATHARLYRAFARPRPLSVDQAALR